MRVPRLADEVNVNLQSGPPGKARQSRALVRSKICRLLKLLSGPAKRYCLRYKLGGSPLCYSRITTLLGGQPWLQQFGRDTSRSGSLRFRCACLRLPERSASVSIRYTASAAAASSSKRSVL